MTSPAALEVFSNSMKSRILNSQPRCSLIGATLFACFPALALSPAPESALLCAGSHVVEATVESAQVKPEACIGAMFAGSTCACEGELSIRVVKVIGVSPSVAGYPEDVGIATGSAVPVLWMQQVWPPEKDGSATCARMRDELLTNLKLVSISTFYGHWADGTNHVSGPPFGAHYWPLTQLNWAIESMKGMRGDRCPALPETVN